jgi:uncharacterized protein involved in response to NO
MTSIRLPVLPAQPEHTRQQPFARTAPVLSAALWLGASGGFVLATVLTLAVSFNVPLGAWWTALAQAHGHLQLYGWVGFFVLGVLSYILPRLRGTPLVGVRWMPWVVAGQVGALALRALCQPLAALSQAGIWRAGLVLSGIAEAAALGTLLGMLALTLRNGPSLRQRPALSHLLPLMLCALASLGLAALVNLVNMIAAARDATGIVPDAGDTFQITLGLLGFIVPVALAMSAQSLPMYAGLDAFPKRRLQAISGAYIGGLALYLVGILANGQLDALMGVGMLALGGALGSFIVICLGMMRRRGKLPQKVARLAPAPARAAQTYRAKVATERQSFGPFVPLIASAFSWALFAGVLLVIDGVALLFGANLPVAVDAVRHSIAIGFLAMLLCGISVRMIPGFSGGHIRSAQLVAATLWLGNAAALLRVGSIILTPWLAGFGSGGLLTAQVLFGLSGPCGLALAICLLVNLQPALWPQIKSLRALEQAR